MSRRDISRISEEESKISDSNEKVRCKDAAGPFREIIAGEELSQPQRRVLKAKRMINNQIPKGVFKIEAIQNEATSAVRFADSTQN